VGINVEEEKALLKLPYVTLCYLTKTPKKQHYKNQEVNRLQQTRMGCDVLTERLIKYIMK
jgi:hypothetical protein